MRARYLMLSLAMAVGLAGCEDILTEKPRSTIVTDDCAVGMMSTSSTLTWGGRVATQRTASAMSSACRGSVVE